MSCKGDGMLGWLGYVQGKGGVSVAPERVAGMPLLRGTLYEPEGLSPWRRERRLRKLKRLLAGERVKRLIIPAGFPYEDFFSDLGRVDALPFYRSIADMLALERLRLCGMEPKQAVIALSAPRLYPELTAAAMRLCPQVRGLLIDVPGEGERYAAWLHRAYGLPIGTPAHADVTVAFAPGSGRWGRVLLLSEERVSLAGLRVSAPSLELPRDCEQQLLAALWEQGLLGREALRVVKASVTP